MGVRGRKERPVTVIPLTPTHQAIGIFYDYNQTALLQDLALRIGASLTRAGHDITGITPDMIYQASAVYIESVDSLNGYRVNMRFPAAGDERAGADSPNRPADVELIGGALDGEILHRAVTPLTLPVIHVPALQACAPGNDPTSRDHGPASFEYRRAGYDLHNQRWTYQLCKDTTP